MNRKIVNFQNLDAIRFFAFFSVFTSHLFFFKPYIDETWFGFAGRVFLQNGDLGVTLVPPRQQKSWVSSGSGKRPRL